VHCAHWRPVPRGAVWKGPWYSLRQPACLQGAIGATAHNRVVATVRLATSISGDPELAPMAGVNCDLVRHALLEWLPSATAQAGCFRSYGTGPHGLVCTVCAVQSANRRCRYGMPPHTHVSPAVFAELLLREVRQLVVSHGGPSTVAVAIACSILRRLPACAALGRKRKLLEALVDEVIRCVRSKCTCAHTHCSIGMSHMAEYICCSSVAFERPDENTPACPLA
jgi:hypothetical protein